MKELEKEKVRQEKRKKQEFERLTAANPNPDVG